MPGKQFPLMQFFRPMKRKSTDPIQRYQLQKEPRRQNQVAARKRGKKA